MATPKQRRPRAETPKGFQDLFGAEVTERDAMLRRIAEVYRAHGFDPLETSAVETVEALGKFLPDVDRPNEGVFAWQEEPEAQGDWLALRYDLTAPLARVFAQHRASLPRPYRRYAMGPVWRNEKPGPGRFRQFTQCDADTVGSASVAADAEIVGMLCDGLEAAGISRKDYIVKINNRKVLNGILTSVTLREGQPLPSVDLEAPGAEKEKQRENENLRGDKHIEGILRTIDKFDKVGADGVRQLLTKGRKDQSGAFIEGLNLSEYMADGYVGFLLARGSSNKETLDKLRYLVRSSYVGLEGVRELETMTTLLIDQGFGPDRIVVDPAVVRGLGYYTGPVFEAELTFETVGDDGLPRQFGSVAGGGRYDDLVKRFTGEAVPATGVSIGVDRLLAALRATKRAEAQGQGPIVVTVMDRDRVGDALALAAELRRAGLRAEAYLGNPKSFGAQLKYADRRGSPFALIEGSDERARGVVQVKDLAAGARAAETASLEEWRDRPAQAEVPRAQVASHLKRLLAS